MPDCPPGHHAPPAPARRLETRSARWSAGCRAVGAAVLAGPSCGLGHPDKGRRPLTRAGRMVRVAVSATSAPGLRLPHGPPSRWPPLSPGRSASGPSPKSEACRAELNRPGASERAVEDTHGPGLGRARITALGRDGGVAGSRRRNRQEAIVRNRGQDPRRERRSERGGTRCPRPHLAPRCPHPRPVLPVSSVSIAGGARSGQRGIARRCW
jgi:hypothetical protein